MCEANSDNIWHCVIQFGYINAGKSWIIGIFHVISGVWLHFAGKIPETWEIWGKMSYKSSQKATFDVAFPKYSGYLVNLLHLCEDFSKDLGDSIQNAGVLQSIYGINVGKIWFPYKCRLVIGSVGKLEFF